MKKIICIALISVIALASCNREEGINTDEVKFIGGVLQTRVGGPDGTIWDAGDPVGIYMLKADPGTLDIANILTDNKEYIASYGTSTVFAEADGIPIFYPGNGSNVKFLAYHPYSSSVTSDYKLPIDLSNQSNQSKLDVLYVPVTATSYNKNSSSAVPLNFSHKLSKLVFNISNGGAITEPVANGITIKISNQQITGVLDLTNGTVTPSGTTTHITTQSTSSGTIVTAEAVVFPCTASNIEVTFTNNADETFTFNAPNIEWKEGFKYTYLVTLNQGGGLTISGTISAWDNGGTVSWDAIEDTPAGFPYNIDISGANFSDCYIYEIWDDVNHIKIGELCKEYLHKNVGGSEIVKKQTIVAYPMLPNGKANLSKGLVVETGHFIAWNPSPTASSPDGILASYTTGESVGSMPSMIYLGAGASRMTTIDISAPPAERINAVLKPYIVKDERTGTSNGMSGTVTVTVSTAWGNQTYSEMEEEFNYRVVKVGTQYWMAENLRTTRYNDGEPIPTNTASAAYTTTISPSCCIASNTFTVDGTTFGYGTYSQNANATTSPFPAMRVEYGVEYNFSAIVGHGITAINAPFIAPQDMISPAGWHIPNYEELEILRNYVTQSTATDGTWPEFNAQSKDPAANLSGLGLKAVTRRRGDNGNYNTGTVAAYMTSMTCANNPALTTEFANCIHGLFMYSSSSSFTNPITSTSAGGGNMTATSSLSARCLRNE